MENVPTYLLTQGSLGIGILVLGYVVSYQQKKIDRQNARIEELHGLRLEDSKQITKEFSGIIDRNAEASRILAEKIELSKAGRR